MNAQELIQWLTNATFVVLFAATAVNAWRARTRLAVNAALLFAALGSLILVQLLPRLGVTLPAAAGVGLVAVIALLPYLMLRLAQDFTPVPRLALNAALAAAAAAAALAGIALASGTLPAWAAPAIVVDFFGFGSYAAWLFVRAARRSTGATRIRLFAAAAGSLALGLALLIAGLRIILPVLAPFGTNALALVSAVAYFLAFAPPAFARRAWREPDLRRLLRAVALASSRSDTAQAGAELETAIVSALPAERAHIVLRGVAAPADLAEIAADAMALRRALTRQAATGSVAAAPILIDGDPLGAIAVSLGRSQAFPEETIALLELFAEQAAIVLEAARLRDEVTAASRAKSEFLANMSHELRTPLNAILGFSTLLRESDDLPADKRDRYLANIGDAGEHLLALINDVLDLSTVESGRIRLRPDRTSVNSLIDPVIATARSLADVAGVAFSANVEGTQILRVDAQRVRQMLLNLLSNAVKFTPEGGRVSLVVTAAGHDLTAEVRDTGIGIPAEQRHRMYGVFERVNEGRSNATGTGLGLALTKRLVELHGGTIEFESEPGAGTVFRIRLPDVVAQEVSAERVLVVEDEERDAQLICALAAQVGLGCEVVATVAGALEAISRHAPLGVVLDLRLPDGRGEQVLAAVRGAASTHRLPVGVVTVEDGAPAAHALGASLVLTKPIEIAVLSAWLRQLRDPSPAEVAS